MPQLLCPSLCSCVLCASSTTTTTTTTRPTRSPRTTRRTRTSWTRWTTRTTRTTRTPRTKWPTRTTRSSCPTTTTSTTTTTIPSCLRHTMCAIMPSRLLPTEETLNFKRKIILPKFAWKDGINLVEWKELKGIEDRSTIVTRDCYRLHCCFIINYFYINNFMINVIMPVINMIESE